MRKIVWSFTLLALGALLFLQAGSQTLAAPQAQLTPFPTPTAGPDGRILYTVQSGDSLWRIAAVAGIPLDELRALNNLGPDDIITPGQKILLGLGGPAGQLPTQGPAPTATSELPTPTPGVGTGDLCILLYEDVNGDAVRQEDELSLPGGAISVNDRLGDVSLTADTPSGGISDALFPDPEELGFTCFRELEPGDYNITVAIPDGYNPTTPLSFVTHLFIGDETLMDFGAQPNSDTLAREAIPITRANSPLLGTLGILILVAGVGFGIYVLLFQRR
jgi:hypothetical protein